MLFKWIMFYFEPFHLDDTVVETQSPKLRQECSSIPSSTLLTIFFDWSWVKWILDHLLWFLPFFCRFPRAYKVVYWFTSWNKPHVVSRFSSCFRYVGGIKSPGITASREFTPWHYCCSQDDCSISRVVTWLFRKFRNEFDWFL